MTWLAILKLVGGWRAAVFLAVAVAALAFAGIQTHRLDTRTTELAAAVQARDVAVALNATNVQTIETLKKANADFAKAADERTKAAEESAAAVASERDALAAELDRRRTARENLYETDPSAAEWGRARVPDGVLRGLRQ